jgi:pilus assembly protein CpaE
MADATLRMAVISADPGFRATVADVLHQHGDMAAVVLDVPVAASGLNAESIDRVQSENADVILVDLSGDPAGAMPLVRLLGGNSPGRTLIATGPALSPELLLEGMKAGIADYLPAPVDTHDLADALSRGGRRLGRGGASGRTGQGRVVTFMGAKGGTGVTTAVVNAGTRLHTDERRTLLLDLNLEGGNLAVAMGLKPRYSIMDLLENFHRVDESMLSSLVVKHASGADVLAAPLLPESAPAVTADQARAAVRLLRRHYDLILIDLARPYSEYGRAAVDGSDLVFLFLVPDVLAIHGAKRLLPLLRRGLEGRAGRVEVVLSRGSPEDEIQKHDVREALDVAAVRTLRRDDSAVHSAVNLGQPLSALNGGRSRYSRDLHALCGLVDASIAPEETGGVGRFLERLAGGRRRKQVKT